VSYLCDDVQPPEILVVYTFPSLSSFSRLHQSCDVCLEVVSSGTLKLNLVSQYLLHCSDEVLAWLSVWSEVQIPQPSHHLLLH